ncbi:MAG: bacterioferritin, partial [Actinobacteria bacterium ATB1]|nr:bacterioferritin [Actinobacteria bacterium ATB1]
IERILYFDAHPDVQRLGPISLGGTVQEQFQLDLRVEYDAVARLNNGIRICTEKGDNGTRDLLEVILVSEEEHVDWLETQLGLIDQLGAKAYLAEQM